LLTDAAMFRDLHFAFRQLKKSPGFALVAVTTLALGIGASTAIFSAVNPILFRPLSYPDSDRVMRVWENDRTGAPAYVCFGTYHGMLARQGSFEALAAMKPWQPAMIGSGEPARLEGQQVTPDFFRVLGIQPMMGRDFQPSDDQFRGPQVVILSSGLWHARFAADPEIIGRKITLDEKPYTVIGVMPASFENVLAPAAELWSPLQYNPALPTDGREWGHHLQMIGRLRPGIDRYQAQAESTAILQQLGQLYAKGYNGSGGPPSGLLVYGLQEDVARDVRPALLAIMGGIGLVLLIVCVNVTNLLLARGAQRRAEFALRLSLGARRARLLQQLLIESMLLAFAGGVLAIGFARIAIRVLVTLSPPDLPRLSAIWLDGEVFGFAFAITTLVALAVGAVPALQAAHSDPHSGLQLATRTTTAKQQLTRRALVVCEVAISFVLLVSAGLLLRTVQQLFATPPGFNSSQLLTMQVQDHAQNRDDAARARFYELALQAVQQVPGVMDAAFTSQLPLSGDIETFGAEFQAYPNQLSPAAFRYAVSPSYFQTMSIPLLRGRLLTENDRAGAPVAVVLSESFAKRMFPGQDPIGQQMRAGPDAARAGRPWDVVVGLVGDVKQQSLALKDGDAFYTTTSQWAWVDGAQSLVVRTQGDPARLIPALRSAIWSVDKDQPIVRIATMDELVARSEAQRHFALVLFEAFALIGLLLAATGIYGILAGSVTERTREIGVRAALGASPKDILAMVFRQGMRLTFVGLAIGFVGALAAARALASLLFGVSGHDLLTYLGVAAVLVAVAAVACWIPSRRAAQVDPAITLRAE
jgi:predicted permease